MLEEEREEYGMKAPDVGECGITEACTTIQKWWRNYKAEIQDKEGIPPDQHDSDGDMRIFVKTLTNTIITINVETYNTVDNVKAIIKNMINIPKGQQRLIFVGSELEDSTTLDENNIQNESTLYLVPGSVLRFDEITIPILAIAMEF